MNKKPRMNISVAYGVIILMADTDIILSVDLDVADADRTAEQLHKEIQRIFQSRNGEQSAALTQLELQMKRNVDKAQELRESLDKMSDAKIPTAEYEEVSQRFQKLDDQFGRLLVKQDEMQELGKTSGPAWEALNVKMEQLGVLIREDQAEMQRLVETGKAFTLGKDTQAYQDKQAQLDNINDKLKQQIIRHNEIAQKEAEQANKQGTVRKQVSKTTQSMNALRNATERVRKSSNKTTSAMSQGFSNVGNIIKKGIRTLLMWGLGIHGVMALINKLRSVIKEGFSNLEESKISKYTEQINNLRASFAQMKNALAGAFEPIVTTILPYLQKLVDWLTIVIDKIAQFIAALRGQKTYIKAIKQVGSTAKQTGKDIADAVDEAKGGLASFDKLNNLTSEKNRDTDSGAGAGGAGAGSLFEEALIDGKIFDLLEKMKATLQKIKKIADKIIIQPFKKGFLTVFDDFDKKLKEIRDNFFRLRDSILSIFEDVDKGKAVKALESVFELLGAIVGLFVKLEAILINSALLTLSKFFENNHDQIVGFIDKFNELIAEINGELVGILDSIGEIFEVFDSEEFTSFASEVMGVIYSLTSNTVIFILTIIKDVLSYINDKLATNVDKIKESLLTLFSKATPYVQKLREGMDAIWTIIFKLYELLKPALKWIIDAVGAFIHRLSVELTPILQTLFAFLDVSFNLLIGLLKTVAALISGDINGAVESMRETFRSVIESILGWMDNLSKSLSELFMMINDVKFDGIFSGATIGTQFKMPTVSWHAAGGVIPPTASPHLVGVGDNNRETEVISPLSTIEQALRNVFAEQNINVTFEVQGDPNRIFNVVRKESQTFNKSHGYSAFA